MSKKILKRNFAANETCENKYTCNLFETCMRAHTIEDTQRRIVEGHEGTHPSVLKHTIDSATCKDPKTLHLIRRFRNGHL